MNTRLDLNCPLIFAAKNEKKRTPYRKEIFRAGVTCFLFCILLIAGLILRDYEKSGDIVYALFNNRDNIFIAPIPYVAVLIWWSHRVLATRTVGSVMV